MKEKKKFDSFYKEEHIDQTELFKQGKVNLTTN